MATLVWWKGLHPLMILGASFSGAIAPVWVTQGKSQMRGQTKSVSKNLPHMEYRDQAQASGDWAYSHGF